MAPDGTIRDPTRPLAPPGMQIVNKTGRQVRAKRALGALRGEEVPFDDDAMQVMSAHNHPLCPLHRLCSPLPSRCVCHCRSISTLSFKTCQCVMPDGAGMPYSLASPPGP